MAKGENVATSEAAPTRQQQMCVRAYEESRCADFFKENPELGRYALNCSTEGSALKDLKACGTGVLNAAKEIKELVAAIVNGITESPEEQKRLSAYYNECAKSMNCKLEAIEGVTGEAPGDTITRTLNNVTTGDRLQHLIYLAKRRINLQNREQARQIILSEPDSPARDQKMDALIPGWSSRKEVRARSLWDAAYNAGKFILKADAYYNDEVKLEAVCHGLTLLVAPGAAIKAGSKLAHIAEVLQRGSRATRELGRPMTFAQRTAIQSAHEETDLRIKAEILRDAGLNPTERRKILEAGIAGETGSVTAADVYQARLSVGILENEKMLNSRQIEHLKRRIAECDKGIGDACRGSVSAIKAEYQRALSSFRVGVEDLEKRLFAKIEAGDEAEDLMKLWIKVSDCGKAAVPANCMDVMIQAEQRLTQGPTVTIASTKDAPYFLARELDFLNRSTVADLQNAFNSMNNKAAKERATAYIRENMLANYPKLSSPSRAVESVVGKNPRVVLDHSKAMLESVDGSRRVFFDPVNRYFTVKYKRPDGTWDYERLVPDKESRLVRPAKEGLAGGGHDLWVRLTHFGY